MRYVPHTGLYLPARQGLGGTGSELVPSGFQWPTNVDYAAGLIDGMAVVAGDVGAPFDAGGLFNPPIMDQIGGVTATLEAATNLKLSQLAGLTYDLNALFNATEPAAIASAVTNLVTGEAATQAIQTGLEVAGVASEALDMIPVLGSIISGVVSFAVSLMDDDWTHIQATKNCQEIAERQQLAACQRAMAQATPQPTAGTAGPQPSDLFRPVAYAMQGRPRYALPISVASMFIVLCGGETQGAFQGGVTRDDWRKIVAASKQSTGNSRIGIPQAVQRRMWKLCKGIMAGVNDPAPGKPVMGDNGLALMPMLQDICWNLLRVGTHEAPSRGNNFGIDGDLLTRVSGVVTGKYKTSLTCSDAFLEAHNFDSPEGAGQVPKAYANCAMMINMAGSFSSALRYYQNGLIEAKVLNQDLTWNTAPKKKLRIPKGLLTFAPATLAKLEKTAEAARQGKKAVSNRKAAIATTTVVAGAGALWMARRIAKKKRGRW